MARQAPLSMGFSRQEYWRGVPFPSPEALPNPGIEPRSPALQADSLPFELQDMLEFRVDTFIKNTHHPSGLSLDLTLNIRLRKGKYISYIRIWVNTLTDILSSFFPPQ